MLESRSCSLQGARATEAKLGQRAVRERLVDKISRRAPWLELTSALKACIDSDDALDVLHPSLLERQLWEACSPAEQSHRMGREGWILSPGTGTLEQLL